VGGRLVVGLGVALGWVPVGVGGVWVDDWWWGWVWRGWTAGAPDRLGP